MFKVSADTVMTKDILHKYINKHQQIVSKRYQDLDRAYRSDYKIFRQARKPSYKPDNRLAVNFGKYIVDTMNGFFIGNPIKITSDDEAASAYVELLSQYNDQDNNDAELSKLCDIFGRAYEMYYIDEKGMEGITYLSPMQSFMITDDSILERPLYFVRLYRDEDNVMHGSVADAEKVLWFTIRGSLKFEPGEKPHGFDGVPAVEFKENDECIGIFEPVMTLIDAYNHALSEKANDVDYFADAYMKILGAKLSEEEIKQLRTNRIINFDGDEAERLIVEFLEKPNADVTQENLIDRLEKLIFQISMVANISDESFGISSGIALKYKLQAMSNLAKTKERKFTSGMNDRYRLLFSNPIAKTRVKEDAWVGLKYQFTLNYPANLLEEAQIASLLSGITSKETQLKILSVVDNVSEEEARIEDERDPLSNLNYDLSRG